MTERRTRWLQSMIEHYGSEEAVSLEMKRVQLSKSKNTPYVDRLMDKFVCLKNGCWEWRGAIGGNGYGKMWVPATGKLENAHRAVFEFFVSEIPRGMHLDHLCKNIVCVNFGHMEIVTPAENNRRSTSPSALNAIKTHCPKGHEYSVGNTYLVPRGGRDCILCQRQRVRDWRNRVKTAKEMA